MRAALLALCVVLRLSTAFVVPTPKAAGARSAPLVRASSNPFEQLFKGFQELQQSLQAPEPLQSDRAAALAREWASILNAEEAATFLRENLAEEVLMEDLTLKDALLGKESVLTHVVSEYEKLPEGASRVLDLITDGDEAAGWTWTLQQGNLEGLRGLTFIEVDEQGKVSYIREGVEPLFKLGGQAATLLKAVLKEDEDAPKATPIDDSLSSDPQTCSEAVKYLWLKAQFLQPGSYALNYFSDDIVYEDLNFEDPFKGTEQVAAFLEEFEIPGLRFLPEKISDGKYGCAFTWKININDSAIRGLSLYTAAPDSVDKRMSTAKINYIRDIPEPAIKPPPVLALAKALRPGLQTFEPRPIGGRVEQNLDLRGEDLVRRITESGATGAPASEFALTETVLKAGQD